jgi:hypothetical protein
VASRDTCEATSTPIWRRSALAVDQLPSGKWRARVYASGRIIATRTFTLKTDARTWEAEQVRQLAMGTYLPPARGKLTLGELAEQWMKARANAVATSTLREEGYSLAYLPPTLRDRPMAALRPAHFDALYATLLGKLARSTVSRFRNAQSTPRLRRTDRILPTWYSFSG